MNVHVDGLAKTEKLCENYTTNCVIAQGLRSWCFVAATHIFMLQKTSTTVLHFFKYKF